MQQGISVVIPNYNGTALLSQTLPTVFRALETHPAPSEVIVADDCSTDDSLSFLQQHYPSVRIVSNARNSGFSVTANLGIRSARLPLVLLLNSDVKLEPGYFNTLCRYFEKNDTFGVMGRIIGWEDELIQDGAKWPSFHSAKIKTSLNYLLQDEAAMRDGLYTMYLSGANALLHRDRFLEIGGFNEMFSPFYVEDYELSLRAWRLGWRCYYEHAAVCRHRTSTTIRSKSRKSYIKMISNRNKWYVHAIHLDGARRWLWAIQMLPEVLVQTVLLKTWYPRAFVLFLKGWGGVRRSRRRLRALGGEKLRSVSEVASFIQASVRNKKIRFFRGPVS